MFSLLLNIILLITNPGSLDSAVQQYVESQLTGYEKISYEYVSDWNKFENVEINKNSEAEITGNLLHVPVSYIKNGKSRNTKLAVRVEAYKTVLVSNSNIKRGEALNANLFNHELINCITLIDPITSLSNYSNYRTASYLKEGETLVGNSIEPMPAVRNGDRLIAHSIAGNVDIQVSAVARQEGSIDDIIRVKTQDNKLYKARVVDNSNVLIIE